jgi:hypothetical protein
LTGQACLDKPSIANIAGSLNDMATAFEYQGDIEKAGQLYADSLVLYRALRNDWGIATGLNNTASVLIRSGQLHEAFDALSKCLEMLQELGYPGLLAICLQTYR